MDTLHYRLRRPASGNTSPPDVESSRFAGCTIGATGNHFAQMGLGIVPVPGHGPSLSDAVGGLGRGTAQEVAHFWAWRGLQVTHFSARVRVCVSSRGGCRLPVAMLSIHAIFVVAFATSVLSQTGNMKAPFSLVCRGHVSVVGAVLQGGRPSREGPLGDRRKPS